MIRIGAKLYLLQVNRQSCKTLVKEAKEERFPKDIKNLIWGKEVRRKNSWNLLRPLWINWAYYESEGSWSNQNYLIMQQTPCTCQGNITSPNCCRSPLLLPSCRGNHALTQVRNQYWVIDDPKEVQNSDKECKVCERIRGQPAVQIMAPLPGSKPEKSVCKILCWLRWAPYNQDYTKIIC